MALEKTNRINTLLSFYESLLSDKQRKYMNLYYREDLSLTEIAESFGVSRQAVYDAVNRSEKTLETYEEDLHLVKDFSINLEVIEKAIDYVEENYPEDKKIKFILNQFKIRE